MIIRPATLADLYWLRLLLGQLVEETLVYPQMSPRDFEAHTAILASRLGAQDPSLLCYVAEDERVVGGYVSGNRLARLGAPHHYLFVDFFYVVPAWRNQGVGRALSTTIIQAAQEVGCEGLEFIQQTGDHQWDLRGWPVVGTVHALPLDAALTTVVPTKVPNGHGDEHAE